MLCTKHGHSAGPPPTYSELPDGKVEFQVSFPAMALIYDEQGKFIESRRITK